MSLWRGLGPALPRPGASETLKAALGLGLGLVLVDLVLWPVLPGGTSLLLIAPFGASAFLVFVVPSSPLAQPWSVVVGNTVSGLASLLVLTLPLPWLVAAGAGVALSVAFMALARAQHPPGGAVALVTVLMAQAGHPPGWDWLFAPVALGSGALVVSGLIWSRLSGRTYPLRAPAAPVTAHGTADTAPQRRLTPPAEALATSLTQLRLAANIGVEDLARVLEHAEALAPDMVAGALPARAVMSRDVVAVAPETALPDLADLFRRHGFKSLPVLDHQGHFLGLVRLVALAGRSEASLAARDLMEGVQALPPDANLTRLIETLADGRQESVPILEGGRLEGIVTRSDLIAALLHDLGLR